MSRMMAFSLSNIIGIEDSGLGKRRFFFGALGPIDSVYEGSASCSFLTLRAAR